VSGEPTPLTADQLERLLREPAARERERAIVVSSASLARLASRTGLVDELQRRFRFAGSTRPEAGEPLASFEPKRQLIALTLDYETWQPLPPGVTIDWDEDVFEPARRFAAVAEAASARFTYFVEMGELLYLQSREPQVAEAMERQLHRLVRAGHGLELHLHPDWLPELGARQDGERWHWDHRLAHAADYPGDLSELVARCRRTLESLVEGSGTRRAVRVFRAGAYRAQPFSRLSAALLDAGIACDSSVHRGGVSAERGYDYTHAFSAHQPYFCSRDDPQLAAPAGDESVVELPIATLEFGSRWSLDGAGQSRFAVDLLRFLRERQVRGSGSGPTPAAWRARERLAAAAHRLSRGRLRSLPRHPAYSNPGELRHGHDYFVAIGHTKGAHDLAGLASQLDRINRTLRPDWVTIGAMAEAAREDLSRTREWKALLEAASRAGAAVAEPAARRLPVDEIFADAVERVLPWAGTQVRVLGDHARAVAGLIGPLFPWKQFRSEGADAQALASISGERLAVAVLAHSTPPAAETLRSWASALGPTGRLVVPVLFERERMAYPELPSAREALLREWRFRLENAGFGTTSGPPSRALDLAGVVVGRPGNPLPPHEHFGSVMDWLYAAVEPADDPSVGIDPRRVLTARRALCLGYVSALGAILERDGFDPQYVTLLASRHERGRGPESIDSHEVLLVPGPPGPVLLDPMANVIIPFGLLDVLRDPTLAKGRSDPDERYRTRRYDLYATSYLYDRTFEACVRPSLDVMSYDESAGWRARLKLLLQRGRRAIYRKRDGVWRRVPPSTDPRPGRPGP
jgi:hypothetical protein